jgi:two-component system response regulator AtoC
MNVLIADDEKGIRIGLSKLFQREGHESFTAEDYESALECIRTTEIHIALLDIRMGDRDGVELLKSIQMINSDVICLMITGYGSISNAVEAMREGAADYLLKPLDNEYLLKAVNERLELKYLKNENLLLKEEQQEKMLDFNFRTNNPKMKKILTVADKVKDTDTTVLITGDSGTGKEVLSRYIHFTSNRHGAPFIGVNCAALSETLLLSELFGHEKGAFTGAHERKIGKFELADRGTLFLDEIGDMSPDAQAKLLRVLEEGTLERVGGNRTVRVNIRVIAATNQDLVSLIQKKEFREDLYYRLNVISLVLPSLKDRPEDILLLAEYFKALYGKKYRKGQLNFSPAACESMKVYGWPGNIRELKNLINQTVLLTEEATLETAGLNRREEPLTSSEEGLTPGISESLSLQDRMDGVIEKYEKNIIRETLIRNRFNKTAAAEELGVTRKTLFNKISKYSL